jgi:hypothetical protein
MRIAKKALTATVATALLAGGAVTLAPSASAAGIPVGQPLKWDALCAGLTPPGTTTTVYAVPEGMIYGSIVRADGSEDFFGRTDGFLAMADCSTHELLYPDTSSRRVYPVQPDYENHAPTEPPLPDVPFTPAAVHLNTSAVEQTQIGPGNVAMSHSGNTTTTNINSGNTTNNITTINNATTINKTIVITISGQTYRLTDDGRLVRMKKKRR